MHDDELDVDVPLVLRLLAAQFPEWAELPIEPVPNRGTDNALFRLGPELVARLPVQESKAATLVRELEWLPRLAPHLPLAVPVSVAQGEPGEGYPCIWCVNTWLPGEDATVGPAVDAADALAEFILALQAIDASDGPLPGRHNFGRGEPLVNRDAPFRAALATLDVPGAAAVWEEALAAPRWEAPGRWLHGDLDARNVLVDDGRLSGVIDWGALGVGDPACEAMVAWKLVPVEERDAFRARLGLDDAAWARARGWVVSQAVIALGYYTDETNPVLVAEARRWLEEAL
ncbi:MAG: aminoglycoside phosphotransferase family protein [Gaiellaceae bacterium]